ncbi:MAG: hypothetical protein V3U60_03715, partial [Gammaproteobacteria bacterium]
MRADTLFDPMRIRKRIGVVCLFVTFMVGGLIAQGRQSFFGSTGLSFIPTAEIPAPGTILASYSTRPAASDQFDLMPYSVRWGYTSRSRPLEVMFTNTYIYASRATGVDVLSFEIPFVPSFKYQIVPMDPATGNSAMAFGLTTPYGLFYVYDKHLRLKPAHITLHGGVATKFTTYHAFTGATIFFGGEGSDYQHSLPFVIILEGSWAGSLQSITQMEESFWAVTSVYRWTSSL